MTAKQKTESAVAAREQLDEQSGEGVDPTAQLEEQAKEQEAQQADELKSSAPSSKGAKAAAKLQENSDVNAAAARAGHNSHAQSGLIDNMSRRSGQDALEGHFVSIDLNDKDVQEAYKQVGLEDHRGDYGVYLTPGALDPDTGVPEIVIVRLRDETNARVAVPYSAVRPAESRGR